MDTAPAQQDIRIRALLVEDNVGDARLIREALSSVQDVEFRVECVDRLTLAIAVLAQQQTDVVLLDLSLPDSQGLETISRLQQRAPSVPIVVLTGLENESIAVQALQKGAQDYLGKRFVQVDSAFIVRAIRYAIERKRAEEELARLASFPERSPNPIIETDPSGRVTYLNPAAKVRFPELLNNYGRHPATEGLEAVVEALSRDNQESFTREIGVGKRVYEQRISYVPEVGLVRSYILDITERKQVEHLKDEFLSTVSHELRTPLATIKEFIAIIADGIAGTVSEDQARYLGIIKTNIDRLARMISDLLDMAKIESGHVVLNKTVLQAAPLLEHVIQSMRPLAQGKQIELRLDVPAVLPDIFADSDKIAQVLINLVGNAIKFTGAGGHVTVGVREQESEILFSVGDNGVGIDEKDLPKLFDKFQQFRRMPSGSGSKGTGLGLAISKRFVELHGGRIWAESQAGVGSTFSFALPRYHVGEIFKDYLKMGLARAKQAGAPLSMITTGIVDFAQLKGQYGPEAMWALLSQIEQRIRQEVKLGHGDVVVRWQTGDMLVILAEVDKPAGLALAQQIKAAVENRPYPLGHDQHPVAVAMMTVTFPDDAQGEQEFLRAIEDQMQAAGHIQPRILVVDDEPKIRQFLKELLEMHSYQVMTAASGPEALELLKLHAVDMVLLDVVMPVMDGYEVYHLLRENPKTRDVPIIIITAQGERVDRLLGMQSSSYNYVTKPFEPDMLLVKIRELFQHRPPRAAGRAAATKE